MLGITQPYNIAERLLQLLRQLLNEGLPALKCLFCFASVDGISDVKNYDDDKHQQVDDYVQYHLPFGPAVKLIIYNTDDHVPAILRFRMEDRT